MARSMRDELAMEDDHLIAVFDWAAAFSGRHPELLNLFHVPNEAKMSRVTVFRNGNTRTFCPGGQRMNRKGRKKGYPDIGLDVARHGFHGLRIELKRKGNPATKDQLDWIYRLNNQGYMAIICIGSVPAIETIANYLGIRFVL